MMSFKVQTSKRVSLGPTVCFFFMDPTLRTFLQFFLARARAIVAFPHDFLVSEHTTKKPGAHTRTLCGSALYALRNRGISPRFSVATKMVEKGCHKCRIGPGKRISCSFLYSIPPDPLCFPRLLATYLNRMPQSLQLHVHVGWLHEVTSLYRLMKCLKMTVLRVAWVMGVYSELLLQSWKLALVSVVEDKSEA